MKFQVELYLWDQIQIVSEVLFFYIYIYNVVVKVNMLVAQSCPTVCDPMDCSPPGSCVHGIFQARILE